MNNQTDKIGIITSVVVTAIALILVTGIGSIQERSIQPQGQALLEGATEEIQEIPGTMQDVTTKTLNRAENFAVEIPNVVDEIIEESTTASELIDNSYEVIEETLPDVPVVVKQTDGKLLELISIPSETGVPGCEKTKNCFIPVESMISPGGEVIWTNNDEVIHTITSGNPRDGPDGLFDSGLIIPGDTYSLEFDLAFEYDYFCLVHPWMEGQIVVG